MITMISANWLLYLIALLIGVVTAFWIWAATGRETSSVDSFDANDGLLEKAGEPVQPAEAHPEPSPPAAAVPEPAPSPPTEPVVEPVAAEPVAPVKQVVTTEAETAEDDAPTAGTPDIPAAVGEPDNLRLIKGVGPKLNKLLISLGITRFDQIADWKEAEINEVDQYLDTFSGRITRDAWIDQAKFLAKDDISGFEKKYGKL
jgi:predicted flap endonuclease-1-like 5' DNA nuclease